MVVTHGRFHESDHPLVLHKLSHMRQPSQKVYWRDYARLIYELGMMLGYEASKDLPLTELKIEKDPPPKPGKAVCFGDGPVIIPIVRSGLILADGMHAVIPTSHIGHIGVYDDPSLGGPREFMVTLPEDMENRTVYIADLFVVRGTYACRIINTLNEYDIDPKRMRFITLMISHKGKERILNDPVARRATFYCARLDRADERWIDDFTDVNFRLYHTENKKNLF